MGRARYHDETVVPAGPAAATTGSSNVSSTECSLCCNVPHTVRDRPRKCAKYSSSSRIWGIHRGTLCKRGWVAMMLIGGSCGRRPASSRTSSRIHDRVRVVRGVDPHSVGDVVHQRSAMSTSSTSWPGRRGKGKVAVILPDTVSSARYTEFDAPYLTGPSPTAGLSPSEVHRPDAQGSDATQLTDAQSAISSGATVLVVNPSTPAWVRPSSPMPSPTVCPSSTTPASPRGTEVLRELRQRQGG